MASHTGHRQRMKAEFLARGIEGWPDHRVLELLLFYSIPQGDVNGLAHDLIERAEERRVGGECRSRWLPVH